MFKETIGPVSLVLFYVLVLCAILTAAGFGVRYMLEPRVVTLDNRVFHESQQYNDGMARDLDNLRGEYLAPMQSNEAKQMIRATILHRFAGYDLSKLPPDQQVFLSKIRGY